MEDRFGVSKSLVDAIKSVMTSKTEELKESAQLNEGEFPHSKYTATNEKSKQFGGYRPHVVHKETNKTMFLGSHVYKNSKDADAHARVYLNAYADGGADKATDASWEYGLKNKNKLVNEEAEQIDELSKTTLKSYVKKSTKAADKAWDKSEKEEDKAMATDGEKYPEKQQRHVDAAKKHTDVWRKRDAGITTATKKLKEDYETIVLDDEYGLGKIVESNDESIKVVFEGHIETFALDEVLFEDVEDLQELSKDTLNSYTTKAKAQVAATEGKRGKPSKATLALRSKRGEGMEAAKSKLLAIYKKESDARVAEVSKANEHLDNHFSKEAPKILEKHGYKKVSEGTHTGKSVVSYVRPHDNGHVSTMTISTKPKAHGEFYADSKHRVQGASSQGYSSSSFAPHSGAYRDFENKKLEMMPNFEKYVIDHKNTTDTSY